MTREQQEARFMAWRWNVDWRVLIAGREVLSVWEVGVGPLTLSILPLFPDAVELVGFEPHHELADKARAGVPGAVIHELALGDSVRRAGFCLNHGSSALLNSWCPTPSEWNGCQVEVSTFDLFDHGEIDVLNIDCEGMEWEVLQRMKSRPALLGIELWPHYPHRNECLEWLWSHGYELVVTTGPEGETMIWRNASDQRTGRADDR